MIYGDTDSGGVMYYANYLRLFEWARAEYVNAAGLSLPELEERNCLFVCRRAEVDYLSPARLGDTLSVETRIDEAGKAYLDFGYTVRREGGNDELTRGLTRMACTGLRNGKLAPQRIPAWLIEALQSMPNQA